MGSADKMWATDLEEERYNRNAEGWNVNSSDAVSIISKGTQQMYRESISNENSNWKAFNNTQRQEIIDLANVSVSADTEWEDISVPDQEDLSIHLVSQGALANADFTGFADEYVNKIKLNGLNVKNHIKETSHIVI